MDAIRTSPTYRVTLNVKKFAERCDQRGWVTWGTRCDAIGITQSTMHHLRQGRSPRQETIAAIMHAFAEPGAFAELFEIVEK